MQKIIENESWRKCVLPEHPKPEYYILIRFNAEVGIVCFYINIQRLLCGGVHNSLTHSLPMCPHSHMYTHTFQL